MFDLTPRLRGIVDLVTSADTVADIGCDHAYVAITLTEEKQQPLR